MKKIIILALIIFMIILTGCTKPQLTNIHLFVADNGYTNVLRLDSVEMGFNVEEETIGSFIDTIAKKSRITDVNMTTTGFWDTNDRLVYVTTEDIVEVTVEQQESSDSAVFSARTMGVTFEGNKEVDRIYYEGYITLKVSDKSLEIIFDDYEGN